LMASVGLKLNLICACCEDETCSCSADAHHTIQSVPPPGCGIRPPTTIRSPHPSREGVGAPSPKHSSSSTERHVELWMNQMGNTERQT
jgi:hypothetical protein